MTQLSANALYWCLGLAAQGTLLALVFARRSGDSTSVARRLPAFAVLLAFYLLRSVLLFVLFGHIAPADYHAVYDALSIADIALQLAVTSAIAIGIARTAGLWIYPRGFLLLLPPAVAAGVAWLLFRMLPQNAPIPPDRLQLFNWLLMLALGAGAVLLPSTPLLRRIAVGFAGYGALGISATALRTVAAVHRDAHSYAVGSYVLASAWLLIVLYWILTLRTAAPSRPSLQLLAAK